jgi:hypothetical protein
MADRSLLLTQHLRRPMTLTAGFVISRCQSGSAFIARTLPIGAMHASTMHPHAKRCVPCIQIWHATTPSFKI